MKALTTEEVENSVADFCQQNQIVLSDEQSKRLVRVAEDVWNNVYIQSMKQLHGYIFVDIPEAGQYRDCAIVNDSGRSRAYPRSDMVYRLMVQVFRPTYERVLAGDGKAVGDSVEEVVWRVGAILRSIHPFLEGNRVLSWVVENHLRVLNRLPIRTEQKPKPDFDHYRQNLFWPYADKMMQ